MVNLDDVRTIETDSFLDHILNWTNADNDVFNVFNTLNATNLTHWLSLPLATDPNLPEEDMDLLYSAFADTANAIVGACSATDPRVELALDLSWHASPNKSAIHPDLLAFIGLGDALDEFKRLEAQIWDLERQLFSGPEGTEAENQELKLQHKELLRKFELWSLRTHVPVEIKATDSADEMSKGIIQLCRYMRTILAKQLDRRFAIGLLLCDSKLTVWLCDRSGLVGMRTAIDIHDEPEKFIQVILSLSRLTPSRLGYDTTMCIYRMDTATYHFSTDRNVTVNHYGSTPHETTWAIQGPRADGSEGELDVYLTVKAISTARALQVMDGPATIVWLVVNERTMERFVLKQSWREETLQTEATFHKSMSQPPSPHICDIVNSVKIRVMDDEEGIIVVDDTLNHIRRGMNVQGGPFMYPERYSDIKFGRQSMTNRVLTRTLMRTYGWPVKFFKDVPELVNTLIDAVKGHRDYWFSLMLHRDVRTGNVLICPTSDVDIEHTSGKLIDLDYSKRSEKRVEYPALMDKISQDEAEAMVVIIKARYSVSVSTDIARILNFRYGDHWMPYLDEVFETIPRPITSKETLTMQDLFLETPSNGPPSWDGYLPHTRHRTGTRAFTSAEIINRNSYRYQGTETAGRKGPLVHSAIHDLESFFWILLYLCLTRDGPGGGRRDELSINEPLTAETKSIYDAVYRLFDSEDDQVLYDNKQDLFDKPDELGTIILKSLHPYFEPLKDLISKWWTTLRFGYITYDDYVAGSIHDRTLAVLEDELGRIQSNPDLHSNMDADEVARMEDKTEKEIQRRKDDLEFIQRRVSQLEESLKRRSLRGQEKVGDGIC